MQNIESIGSDWKTYFIKRRYFEMIVIVRLLSRFEWWRVSLTDSGNLLMYGVISSIARVSSIR